jgi:heat shock factor-binding protein 1
MSYSASSVTSGFIFMSNPHGWPIPPAAPRTATLYPRARVRAIASFDARRSARANIVEALRVARCGADRARDRAIVRSIRRRRDRVSARPSRPSFGEHPRAATSTDVVATPARRRSRRDRDARANGMSTRSAPTRGDAMTRDAGDDAMTSEALATFTQGLLEQMQGRFQTMSDAIITKIDEMQEKIEALERSVEEIASETREGK